MACFDRLYESYLGYKAGIYTGSIWMENKIVRPTFNKNFHAKPQRNSVSGLRDIICRFTDKHAGITFPLHAHFTKCVQNRIWINVKQFILFIDIS
jgi:hypothetical protein